MAPGGQVTEVILNNKQKMNFLTINMLYTMLGQLVEWHNHPEKAPRAIIMSGAGDVAFCSGGNMRGLYDGYVGVMSKYYQPTYTGVLYRTDYALANMKPIHIAIFNGYVMGSGAGICMRARFTIATDNTEWAMPECVAGFITDNAASTFFAKLRGGDIALGLYLAVTGQRVSDRDMLKWGLCTNFVPRKLIQELKEDLM